MLSEDGDADADVEIIKLIH